jgi:hypothetical protein
MRFPWAAALLLLAGCSSSPTAPAASTAPPAATTPPPAATPPPAPAGEPCTYTINPTSTGIVGNGGVLAKRDLDLLDEHLLAAGVHDHGAASEPIAGRGLRRRPGHGPCKRQP